MVQQDNESTDWQTKRGYKYTGISIYKKIGAYLFGALGVLYFGVCNYFTFRKMMQ
jgi:hypothetical protein